MRAAYHRRKVLMVDDEPQVLTSIEHLLEDDFKVLTTTSPEQALQMLGEEEITVVLADQRMPGLSGDQFLRRAEGISRAARILITGYADLTALVQAVNYGHIYAYVAKPWDPVELKLIIQRAAEHYRLEEALKESEARLRHLVAHLPEGVCLLDAQWRVLLANPVAETYLEALAGVKTGEVLARLGESAPGEALARVLTPAGEGLACEVKIPGPPQRLFEVATAPIRSGQAEGEWVLLLREVTQQHQQRQQIQQQERLAAVGQLAAGIAHDFNNLLTVMTSIAQMVERRPDTSEEGKEMLRALVAQGQQAGQLIRQILDFGRRSVAQRRPMDLVPFLRETARLLGRVLPENIRVSMEFWRGEAVVEANPAQLQQALTNLAVNARDAMPGGGELRLGLGALRVEPGEPAPLAGMTPGDWVVLTVSDTGAGMAAQVMEHLFEPFFTTKQPGQGTGLGLAQVYGIVKQHGGESAAESAPGKGSTFRVYLPRAEKAAASPPAPRARPAAGRGETILLVEDKAMVREMTKSMLEYLKYRVLAASNGREAMRVYEDHGDEVDLVLTDMVMPEMGGEELIAALQERDPEIPVVVVTGHPLGEEEGEELLRGIAGYLEKPFTLEQMEQVVSRALKTERREP